MAIGDTFSGFAVNYSILPIDGKAFDDPALALYEDTGSNGARVELEMTSFVTETIEWQFDETPQNEFLNANPTIAYIEFRITYGVTDDGVKGYSAALESFVSKAGVNLNCNIQVENATVTSDEASVKKTATIRVFGENLPNASDIKSCAISARFNVTNPLGAFVSVYFYEIEIHVVSATGGGYVVAFDKVTGKYILAGETVNYGNVLFGSVNSREIRFYNLGSKDVVFAQNGLSLTSSLVIKKPAPNEIMQTISTNQYVVLFFDYLGAKAGANFEGISYACDAFNVAGVFDFKINYTTIAQQNGRLSISYNNSTINNNSIVGLSSYAKDTTNKIQFNIKNVGQASLNILSVRYSGSIAIAEDSVKDNTNLSSNGTSILTFYVDNSSEGAKSGKIIILSNDTNNPEFLIDVAYSILPQTKLILKTGPSLSSATDTIEDGDINALGIVEKFRPIRRSFALSNSGIQKTLIINSITVSNSSLQLIDLPNFPLTLQKNNGNSMVFYIDFLTSESGLKSTDLVIDYAEGI